MGSIRPASGAAEPQCPPHPVSSVDQSSANDRRVPLLIVAGEASGDLHAARLLTELRRLRPDLAPSGWAATS
jgi:hypothetical protein